MSSDFDFGVDRSQGSKKIDFKAIFFNPKEGTNVVRIVSLQGKSFKTHYVKDINGAYVFVKSPGAGDPLIVQGNQPRTRYYLKVIDRESNKVKVWEFGSQIKQQIEEFVTDLKEKRAKGLTPEDDVLTNYNLEIRKRKPGSNPLYMLSMRERLSAENPRDAAALENDRRILETDDIDFEPLMKPWSIEKIKQKILGIGDGESQSAPSQPESKPATASAPAPRPATPAVPPLIPEKPKPSEVMKKAAESDDSWLDED